MAQVTQKLIAAKLGLSQQAVAFALSSDLASQKQLCPETRQRILTTAQQMSYVPHFAARTLASGKTHTIAFITHASLRYAYVNDLIEELEAALEPTGYHLNLELLYRMQDEAAAYRALAPGRCDGVLLFDPPEVAPACLRNLRQRGLPVVLIARQDDPAVDSVSQDPAAETGLGTTHLLECGHRRIALVADYADDSHREVRVQGYRQALAAAGVAFDPALVFPWQVRESPQPLWQQIAACRPAATAVLCYNPELTIALLMEMRGHGVRVPADVAVVSLGDHFLLPMLNVPVTAVDSGRREVARVAVERLMKQLDDPTSKPQQIRVPPSLVIRQSTVVRRKFGNAVR